MQTLTQLNEEFALPDILAFDEVHPGMPRARITTPVCNAELFLQGAHLTQWQPAGHQPALFLSDRSAFTPGKAIRGGIPIIFPWFGAPETSPVHPPRGSASHGFARILPWTLRFVALAGDDLHLSLTLDAGGRPQAPGFDSVQLGLDLILGATLTVCLSVVNAATGPNPTPFHYEEALHAYLHIGDIHQVSVEGLAGTEYLDKTDQFRRKTQTESAVTFTSETDRPYVNTTTPVTLIDPVLLRRLHVTKSNSSTTVLWNPAAALTAKLADLAPEDWQRFACIETANAADNALSLAPGQAHTMQMQLSLQPF